MRRPGAPLACVFAAALASSTAATACTRVHDDPSGGDGGTRPNAYVRAVCAHQARCEPAGLAPYRGSSVEGCHELLTCGGATSSDECVAAIEAAPCEAGALAAVLRSRACTAGVLGSRLEHAAEGEPCAVQRCEEGLVCVNSRSEPSCPICMPGDIVAEGEVCSERAKCEDETYCDDGVCVRPRADGAPCEVPRDCESGYCNGRGTCGRSGPGEPCEDAVDCLGGHVCRSGTCREAPDLGEACDNDEQVQLLDGFSPSRGCKATLACVDGRCIATVCGVATDVGHPCSVGTTCPKGAVCDVHEARCRMLPAEGERCEPDYQRYYGVGCRTGSYCDIETEHCERQVRIGEPCHSAPQCRFGTCSPDSGSCEPIAPPSCLAETP